MTHKIPTLPASAGITQLADPYQRFADAPHPEVVEMGHHDNVQDFGILSFATASPLALLAQFVAERGSGFASQYFKIPGAIGNLRER